LKIVSSKTETSETPGIPDIPKNVREIKPEQMVQAMQNKLTLVEGNSEKARQRILDQIFDIVMQYAKLAESQGKEMTLLKEEITRLQKLCKDKHIDFHPPEPKQPDRKNRAQRRADARAARKRRKK